MAIYKEDIIDIELTTGNIHRSFLNRSIGEGDELADRFGVRLLRNGEAVDISGCVCSGYFIRPSGDTVVITGAVSEGAAYVDLPQACYAVEGQFSLAIKVAGGDVTGTMRIVDGVVSNTTTDAIVDPGTIIPSVEALIEAIEEAVASIPADYSSLWTSLAPAYSTSAPYDVGDLVTYSGTVYRCKVKISSGETWTGSHWQSTKISTEIKNTNTEIADKTESLLTDIDQITGNRPYDLIENAWISTENDTVDVTAIVPNNGHDCVVIPCAEGDVFTISGYGSTTAHRLWVFINSSGSVLTKSASNAQASKLRLKAPANAVYLVCNMSRDYTRFVCSGEVLINKVDSLPTIDDIKAFYSDGALQPGSYTIRFDVSNGNVSACLVSMSAKYTQNNTEDVPTIVFNCYIGGGQRIFYSHTYEFAKGTEYAYQEWVIPNCHEVGNMRFTITVPASTTLDIKYFGCRFEDAMRSGTGNVIFHAHRGFDKLLPAGSYNAMVTAARLGFQSCIEIPKFTADGVAVCFHNDGGSSSKLSSVLTEPDGSAIPELTDDSTISDFTYAELMQWSIGYSKNAIYADAKILTMDDFLRICAKTGMRPIFSIHPSPTLAQWAVLKGLLDKYGLTKWLSVKTGDASVWKDVIDTFGDGNIYSLINIYGTTSTYDVVQKIEAGRESSGATNTRIDAEWFDEGLKSSTYGATQRAQLAAAKAAGYVCSVVLDNGTTGAEMRGYMDMGVTEFTNARHASINTNW